MDLYHSLLSPVWWASVLLCTILLTTVTSWLARRSARRGNETTPNHHTKARRLRLATWAVALLVLANLAMLGSLAAANLRTPRLVGPDVRTTAAEAWGSRCIAPMVGSCRRLAALELGCPRAVLDLARKERLHQEPEDPSPRPVDSSCPPSGKALDRSRASLPALFRTPTIHALSAS